MSLTLINFNEKPMAFTTVNNLAVPLYMMPKIFILSFFIEMQIHVNKQWWQKRNKLVCSYLSWLKLVYFK